MRCEGGGTKLMTTRNCANWDDASIREREGNGITGHAHMDAESQRVINKCAKW